MLATSSFSVYYPLPPPMTFHNMDQNILLSSSIISIFASWWNKTESRMMDKYNSEKDVQLQPRAAMCEDIK